MAVWEKVLWKTQPYDDNHVPASFLNELDRLAVKPRPSLPALIFAALPISQHLAAIALLVAIFYRLLVKSLAASLVGWSVTGAGLVAWAMLQYGWSGKRPSLRGLILQPLILSLLSPLLGTLTSATTSDSIWPLASGLFFVHLLLADFTTGPDLRRQLQQRKEQELHKQLLGKPVLEEVREKSLSSSLSLTSALSASIVIASRLSSTGEVFALVLLAVALFAGWPELAKRVRESGKAYSVCLTTSMTAMAMACLPTDTVAPRIFVIVLVTANLGGPALLWYAWRCKVRRGGGWDVAVVRILK